MTRITDPVVDAVVLRMQTRSEEGIFKFGVTLEDQTMSPIEAIDNAIEEALDTAIYLEKAKRELMRDDI
jgi:hypothetical protein